MNDAASPALRLENIARRYGEGETVVEVLNLPNSRSGLANRSR